MNPQFQRLKDSLYREWLPQHVFIEEHDMNPIEWEEVNTDPSYYLNNFIQQCSIFEKSKQIAEIPINKRIWHESTREEVQNELYKLIALTFPFKRQIVSHTVALQLVENVLLLGA